ncbi:hypothetical protein [Hymenobacter volaticus]|uniref:Uncharacterized protein n=1 Tax=Hymenobacter volaticus TaxID=2932254 RepID=A0ABY4G913_9BACT|nr:hypothetical protein [Hymenobacter volaticus]UOQ66954.1 hypothetical protein MUN86_03310 [Hymenobacter volaticus]
MTIPKISAPRLAAVLASWLLCWLTTPALACRVCRPRVQATIHAPDYGHNLLLILLPVGLLLLLGVGMFFADTLTRRFISPPLHD